jgi:hypothetical protein
MAASSNINDSQEFNIISIDFKNLRNERQKANINVIKNFIKDKKKKDESITIIELQKICNKNALDRVLNMLDITFNNLMESLTDDMSISLLSMYISINSSRQGSKDEGLVLDICSKLSCKLGINIENLSSTAYRPIKGGKIISYEDFKKSEYKKSDCLKSLDGRFTGKINGWIFAKAVFGSGGHQDNVFEEAYTFGKWAEEYGEKDEYYIIIIDTDLIKQFNELKLNIKKNNVIVCSHIEFQQWLIQCVALDISANK